jgi:hypothetical protein
MAEEMIANTHLIEPHNPAYDNDRYDNFAALWSPVGQIRQTK